MEQQGWSCSKGVVACVGVGCVVRGPSKSRAGGRGCRARGDVIQGDPEPTVGGYSQVTQVGGQGRTCSWDQVSVCPCGDVVIAVCGEARKGAVVCVGETARALILCVTGCGAVVAGVRGGNQEG